MSDQITINEIVNGQFLNINQNTTNDQIFVNQGTAVLSVNGKIGIVVLTPNDLGLGLVNNTSDYNKPISHATLTALLLKADLSAFNVLNNFILTKYGNWDSVSFIVNNLSGNWNSVYNSVNTLSANWQTVATQTLNFDNVTNNLSISNSNTVSLSSLSYSNISASNVYTTIKEFAASHPSGLAKGFNVTLYNGKVYTFAGTDTSNPDHYLEINANPFSPIYVTVPLSSGNSMIVDHFFLSDFATSKYTLQVGTNFDQSIYYSELNVVGSTINQNGVVSEYGQINDLNNVLGYSVQVSAGILYLYINYIAEHNNNNTDYLIIKGLRTNHYKS
jgi:hypothetical protein